MAWREVARLDQIEEDDVIAVQLGGTELAIYRIAEGVFATDNICTHEFARLSDGFVEDRCVECPLHQGRFDIMTGEPLCEPVTEGLRTYPVRVENGRILVDIGE